MPLYTHYVTADAIVFNATHGKILLIQRDREPYIDQWAIPGGHLDPGDATIRTAAARECVEETGMDIAEDRFRFVGYWDRQDRDPRGRYISFAFVAEVYGDLFGVRGMDDAADARWFNLAEARSMELAFDHNTMLTEAFGDA